MSIANLFILLISALVTIVVLWKVLPKLTGKVVGVLNK